MWYDVLVDGSLVGKLDKTTVGEKEVQVDMYAPSGGKPKRETEEVVTSIQWHDSVAGRQAHADTRPSQHGGWRHLRLRLGLSSAEADTIEAERKAIADAAKQRKAEEKNRSRKKPSAKRRRERRQRR